MEQQNNQLKLIQAYQQRQVQIIQKLGLRQLTTIQQDDLSKSWDKINSDPRAFAPREQRHISLKRIKAENKKFGKMLIEDLSAKVFCQGTEEDIKKDISRRISEKKKILCVGYGQGYDSGLLEPATFSGYEIWYVDISKVACENAYKEIWDWWQKENREVMSPNVIQGEISSILIDPDSIELDLSTVEGWYMCRTLFALKRKRAELVLRVMGESLSKENNPEGHNWIYTSNPLEEDNPSRLTKTSISLTGDEILASLRLGANRPIEVSETRHECFKRIYTAMLIKAR